MSSIPSHQIPASENPTPPAVATSQSPPGTSPSDPSAPPMPLRRLVGFSAAVSGRLRRGLSTAAAHHPWAMIHHTELVDSPAPRASLQLAAPPCASHVLVPAHLVDAPPLPAPGSDTVRLGYGFMLRAASADGLLLLRFLDLRGTVPFVTRHGFDTARALALAGAHMEPDITLFVLNPLSGKMVRLPDIDGTTKTLRCSVFGILTQSERPHRPPDRYAVAVLNKDDDSGRRMFVMRRFLSETGKWEKVVALPSPLPLGHQMEINQEPVAFAGRLWWVDVSWGAISADPFSDRPDLSFVELPRESVTEPMESTLGLSRYRRIGVSEGRLRYAEVSQQEPFLLSSFVLDDGGNGWTLEHQVALSRLWVGECLPCQEIPRIGVIDPLNASVMHVTIGNLVLAVDMDKEKALGCSITSGDGPDRLFGFLKPCVLPPWLGSCRIPSAGKDNARSKTLSDILVRVDKDRTN
ncbi:unnamed protein product [Urochloa decumbens]|uniref:DUF1618 domain-containing protein n=1 Tax=Urochloa decumbens TaxID=240449 RepID=A0ABC8W2S0_9POAL